MSSTAAAAPRGWEELWDARSVARARAAARRSGALGQRRDPALRGLAQPWLKEAAKRWARARLLARDRAAVDEGLPESSCARSAAGWPTYAPDARAPAAISREVLTDYILFVRTSELAPATQQRGIGTLRALFDRATRGRPGRAAAGAVIHGPEIPSRDYRLPQAARASVFDQFIDPANLALLASEQHRTIVLVLATTGLRVSSVATLARDALEIGSDHHPYLRYRNHKLRREAVLPIGADADRATPPPTGLPDRRPTDPTAPTICCPPRHRRPAAAAAGRSRTARSAIVVKSYVRKADIRDRDGQLASWVHPHLFRHHLATTLINDGVSLPVIQKLLDHASIAMTVRYAHLHDDTLRDAITRWHQRINIRGERIALPVNGPLAGRRLDEGPHRPRPPGAAQRLLRPPARPDLPAPQRLPELRQLPHRQLLPRRPRPTAPAHPDHARRRPRTRRAATDRSARTRPAEPDPHPRRPRRPRHADRAAHSICSSAPPQPHRTGSHDHHHALAPRRTPPPSAPSTPKPAPAARSPNSIAPATEITFAAVARQARVSRQFLYSHDALRAEIAELRTLPRPQLPRVPPRRASENSLRTRLRAALEDNQRLRTELTRLRDRTRHRPRPQPRARTRPPRPTT